MRKIAILIATAAAAVAQVPSGFGIAEAMKHNAEELKRYSYKRRTEIHAKGRSFARVDLVRYVDGKTETIPMETPSRSNSSAPARGLRGRMIQKKAEQKKEEMKQERERLDALLHSYLSPGSDSMRAMLEKATISRVGSGPNADVRIVATGLKKASDSFTLVWSAAHRRPVSIEIRAELDGKPVQLALQYSALSDGTFYAARTVISMPKKGMMISIDTYDYSIEHAGQRVNRR